MTVTIRPMADPVVIRLASRAKAFIQLRDHYDHILNHATTTRKSPVGVPILSYIEATQTSRRLASASLRAELFDLNTALHARGGEIHGVFEVDRCLFRVCEVGMGCVYLGPAIPVDSEPEHDALDVAIPADEEPAQSDRDFLAERNQEYYAALGVTGSL